MKMRKRQTKAWLEAHGFDGLANDECGCSKDNLMPCSGEDIACCKPAYAVVVTQKMLDDDEFCWCAPEVGDVVFTREKPEGK